MTVAVMSFIAVSVALVAEADTRSDRLIDLLNNSDSYRVRTQCAMSLGRIPGSQSVTALIDALDDEHPAVRVAAVRSLGRIGTGRASSALERVVTDPNQPAEVGAQATRSLQRLRDRMAQR